MDARLIDPLCAGPDRVWFHARPILNSRDIKPAAFWSCTLISTACHCIRGADGCAVMISLNGETHVVQLVRWEDLWVDAF